MVEVKTETAPEVEETKPVVSAPVQLDDTKFDRAKILAQVEYYFGDVNLPKDNFMKSEMSKNDGWFSLKSLLKFNRLKNLLNKIDEDKQEATLGAILQECDLVEVHENGISIRRSLEHPLPESKLEERTIYLKNFDKTETTLDELLEHFKSTYEGVEAVIMRYFNRKIIENTGDVPVLATKREFKGSIFVVFKTSELAEKTLNSGDISYKGVQLLKMMQKAYKDKKTAEFLARTESRKKAQKKAEGGDKDDDKETDDKNGKEEEKESVSTAPVVPPNVFVKILSIPDGFSREDIKAKWLELFADDKDKFTVAFIDFNRGEKDAILRLERENAATEALEKFSDGKIPLGETSCDILSLTPEQETEQRSKVLERQQNNRKRGHSGRGHGGRGRGRGRGRGGYKRQRRN